MKNWQRRPHVHYYQLLKNNFMTPIVSITTYFVSAGVVLLDIILVLGFLLMIMEGKNLKGKSRRLLDKFATFELELSLFVVLVGIIASLFYSNFAGFDPCTFCWWQRILLYPQVVIIAVAYWFKKKGHDIKQSLLPLLYLSVAGALLAGYQYIAQMFVPNLLTACGTSGASCAKLYFLSFGYITIPMMALTGFLAIIFFITVSLVYGPKK